MEKLTRLVLVLPVSLLISCMTLCNPAFSQPYERLPYYDPPPPYAEWRDSISVKIDQARHKIEKGVHRGSLIPREANRLRHELDAILDRMDRMQRDGRLNPRERDIIHNDLDRLLRRIYKEKHDYDRR